MTPTIRIDDEIYELLKAAAEPFVDTPSSVLRRLLGLPSRNGSGATEARDSAEAGSDGTAAQGLGERRQGLVEEAGSRRGRSRSSSRHGKRASRAPKGSLLPHDAYEVPILEILDRRGGRVPTREVLEELERRLNDQFTDLDRQEISTGGKRWRNRAQFVRLHLVETGDMIGNSPRGVWEISEQGRRRLASESRA